MELQVQSSYQQTSGMVQSIMDWSNRKGGKIRDKLVTVKAEKPKPLYPRMKAATPIASTAYSNIAGLRPNNSCHSICI